jgi:hypothetical protein
MNLKVDILLLPTIDGRPRYKAFKNILTGVLLNCVQGSLLKLSFRWSSFMVIITLTTVKYKNIFIIGSKLY